MITHYRWALLPKIGVDTTIHHDAAHLSQLILPVLDVN